MTLTGVVKGNSLHRRPEEDRWTAEGLDELRGLPWKMTNPVERAVLAAPNRVDMPAIAGEQWRAEEREFKARNLYVLKSDIEEYGHTTVSRMYGSVGWNRSQST